MQSNIQADAVNRKAFVAEMYALMHEIKLLQTTGQQNLQDKMNVRKIRLCRFYEERKIQGRYALHT